MKEMKLFHYYGRIAYLQTMGILKATDKQNAQELLKNHYSDYEYWQDIKIEEVKFDDNICETYYDD